MRRSPIRRGGVGGDELVLALVREHAGELLRFARRFSICADDAQDAYQRALEKLVLRMRGTPPVNVLSWLRTVLRHEALAVRAERERMLGKGPLDDDRNGDGAAVDPAERVERFERLAHTAEALRGLKPQELTALALRAEGLSYREICERTSWTYTRCNRAVTEGRRALLARLHAIESGAECARWLPVLSRFADGEAGASELAELRPHLRACTGCRATLRGFHAAPGQVGALLPVELLPVVVAAGTGAGGGIGIGRHLDGLLHTLLDRAGVSVLRVHGAIDALPGTKLAAVAASTVAVAGGGAAIEQAATAGVERARPPHVAASTAATVPAVAGPIPASASLPSSASRPASGPGTAGGGSSSVPGEAAFASAGSLPGEFALEQLQLSPSASVRGPAEYAAAVSRGSAIATAGAAQLAARPAFRAPANASSEELPASAASGATEAQSRRPHESTSTAGGTAAPAPAREPTAAPARQPAAAPATPPAFDPQPSHDAQQSPSSVAAPGGEFGGF
ncbi:sigma-70 family RNA polymerase sigma factor [Conexibacter stalactiti]|uniref:Sigma-70 family RNA polymerase sigma factor n=1 Tax=Conexibacter stalactiti TaxID=1940611 RepID=A0ABU4HLJ3_9ACTN|nr:sigma-70 family RNA polymerase sigma factor [Conexibacter stalactiti]MDW5594175.1 sigma-70 family RNA polymerase sigma factor [Conexibacter stalactiti]MEC5034817.1 sigma-70 family RNA polymerase sigma factor [Conexibacter stalactiti]